MRSLCGTLGVVGTQDVVFVRGLEFEGNHGYTAAERRSTRRFRLAIELHTALAYAASSDRIGDTVDYRKVCEIAMEIGTQSTFKLLETLAGSIARAIQEQYPTTDVTIEVEKLMPPCPGVPQSCGIRLHAPARKS